MADATISTKIKLDGEAEYKQRISEINAALGTLDSKIKLLNTTYAGNENSIKGLTEINEILNQKILTQRDKVEQLQEMLQKDAYCPDILIQVSAVGSALNSFSKELLATHIRTCVADGIRQGDDEVIDELVTTLQKLMK